MGPFYFITARSAGSPEAFNKTHIVGWYNESFALNAGLAIIKAFDERQSASLTCQ